MGGSTFHSVVIEEIDGPNGDGIGRAAIESGFEYESEQESESNIDVEVRSVGVDSIDESSEYDEFSDSDYGMREDDNNMFEENV